MKSFKSAINGGSATRIMHPLDTRPQSAFLKDSLFQIALFIDSCRPSEITRNYKQHGITKQQQQKFPSPQQAMGCKWAWQGKLQWQTTERKRIRQNARARAHKLKPHTERMRLFQCVCVCVGKGRVVR